MALGWAREAGHPGIDAGRNTRQHPPPPMTNPTPAAATAPSAPLLQQAAATGADVTRSLPHALGPEKSLLSTMLQQPQEYIGLAIEEKLTTEHFYLPAHSTLFGFLLELFGAGTEIELVSLVQRLLDRGLLDRVGGLATVGDLYTYAPTPGHFRHHLNLVKDKYVLRAIIQNSTDAINQAYDAPEEVAELLDTVEQKMLAIREGRENASTFDLKASVKEAVTRFEQLLSGQKQTEGLATGFEMIDRMSGGLKPGEMFVVAARPSMGKTSFMMNIVEHVCLDQNASCMVFSCEMPTLQLVQRLLYARARFSVSSLAKGYTPGKGDIARVQNTAMEISKSKLFIDDTPGISIDELRAKARRKKRDENIAFIAIDYLQLLRSRTKQAENSREREIAQISGGIKNLAKELGVPILILAQLNRGPETRTGDSLGVPRMSDLRESGSIEQDADLVGLLYRAAYYAKNEEERLEDAGKAELVLAKNRNGETGNVPLTFIADLMRFESGAPAQEAGPG
jgi:replicative DNA helicase